MCAAEMNVGRAEQQGTQVTPCGAAVINDVGLLKSLQRKPQLLSQVAAPSINAAIHVHRIIT